MPLKIALEINDPKPSELHLLAGFLIGYAEAGGNTATVENGADAPEPEPEAAFKPAAPPSQPTTTYGPQLVLDAPPAGNVDKSGLPWDERIHASTRALTADGLWRKKRGVSDADVAAVETQLRGVMAIPSPAVAPPPPAPAPVPQVPPPPPPAADFQTNFVTLIQRVATSLAAGKITQDQIKKCAETAGLPNIQMLYNRPDLLPKVEECINAIIGAA